MTNLKVLTLNINIHENQLENIDIIMMDSKQDVAPIDGNREDSQENDDMQIDESSSQNSFKSRGDFDSDDYGS